MLGLCGGPGKTLWRGSFEVRPHRKNWSWNMGLGGGEAVKQCQEPGPGRLSQVYSTSYLTGNKSLRVRDLACKMGIKAHMPLRMVIWKYQTRIF